MDLKLTRLNDRQYTYVSRTTGTQFALDLTSVSYHINNYCTWMIIDNALSDHRPIVTRCTFKVETLSQVKRFRNFLRANWPDFTRHLDTLCELEAPTKDLEKMLRNFTNDVNTTAKIFIPRGKIRQNWAPYWKDHDIVSLIKERDLLNEQLKINNTEEIRKILAEATTGVEERVAMNKQINWSDFCKTLDPRKDSKFWRITKLLDNSFTPIATQAANTPNVGQTFLNTSERVANELALYFSNASKIEYQKKDKKIKHITSKLLHNARNYKCDDAFSIDITIKDLNSDKIN
ncbi:hypothetical protein TNCT_16591 [Trichonephila clavata]|uniref:Endonuclease/exonuclease/phosphatase domain-containing protein n=1 Tax=Trichonephila clavata TaxID=2740835 RepID=A0A8X6I2P1_TRICU|nr:hypothetical protein TNCT_16591 [Trichonephila clavata]